MANIFFHHVYKKRQETKNKKHPRLSRSSYATDEDEMEANNIYLQTGGATLPFDSTQKADLLSVAMLCPYEGGRAVYLARAMVALFNDTIVFNDSTACVQAWHHYRKLEKDTGVGIKVLLFPNPATDELNYNLTANEKNPVIKIDIFNLSGQLLQTVEKTSLSGKIQLRKFPPSIYSVRVNLNDKILVRKKLSIIR